MAFAFVLAWAPSARAQQTAKGFGLERFYPSPAGGGWFVMDALDMREGLGGAASTTVSYAKNPLVVRGGGQRLPVVSDEALVDLGFAATYHRLRAYVDFDTPLAIKGRSGAMGDAAFAAPDVDPGNQPDAILYGRVGLDARLLGGATDAFRLGAGAQLWLPGGDPGSTRAGYATDGTPRGMGRVLFAGDVGAFAYAGHAGVHVRPLDDASALGGPRGSELLFGAAGGVRVPIFAGASSVIGTEVFGESAFRSLFASNATGLEALLTTRFEGTAERGAQLRLKMGAGGGLHADFGAPEARFVIAIEVFDRGAERDVSTGPEVPAEAAPR